MVMRDPGVGNQIGEALRTCTAIVAVIALLFPVVASAQHDHDSMSHRQTSEPTATTTSPYAGLEARSIKALSPEQIASLQGGEGMGLAMAAELNGFPGPKHVLELADKLGLSPAQRIATEQSFEAMHAAAVELGEIIVEREAELDGLFASHGISGDALGKLTSEIGRLQGELRAVHLRAHLRMVEILSPAQRHAYVTARGYGHGRREH